MSGRPAFRTVARVLAALPDDLESRAHVHFRSLGGDGARWRRTDWRFMAIALSSLEDWLEAERPRFGRAPLRELRRLLEDAEATAEMRRRAA
jgi:hypothetical protein